MSFRNRLTLFFVAIVIVPMVSVAFVLFSLISDNENGKADARLAARQQLGGEPLSLRGRGGGSDRHARRRRRASSRRRCATATTRGRGTGARAAVLARRRAHPHRGPGGGADRRRQPRRGRARAARARRRRRVEVRRPDRLGPHRAGVRAAVKPLTGLDVVVRQGDGTLAETLRGTRVRPPRRRHDLRRRRAVPRRLVPGAGLRRRAMRVSAPLVPGGAAERRREQPLARRRRPGRLLPPRVHLRDPRVALAAAPDRRLPAGRAAARPRRLRRAGADPRPRRVRGARRRVQQDVAPAREPPGGAATRSACACENAHAPHRRGVRLQPRPRRRCWRSSSRTAVDGVGADGGRAVARDGERALARGGDRRRARGGWSRGAEREALEPRASRARPTPTTARARPPAARGAEGDARVAGVVSVWRASRPFTAAERELFHYLAGQAARLDRERRACTRPSSARRSPTS